MLSEIQLSYTYAYKGKYCWYDWTKYPQQYKRSGVYKVLLTNSYISHQLGLICVSFIIRHTDIYSPTSPLVYRKKKIENWLWAIGKQVIKQTRTLLPYEYNFCWNLNLFVYNVKCWLKSSFFDNECFLTNHILYLALFRWHYWL